MVALGEAKAKGVNPKRKSGEESLRRLIEGIAISRQLLQPLRCQTVKAQSFPLDFIRVAERVNLPFGQPKFSTKPPRLRSTLEHTGEDTPAMSLTSKQHGK